MISVNFNCQKQFCENNRLSSEAYSNFFSWYACPLKASEFGLYVLCGYIYLLGISLIHTYTN